MSFDALLSFIPDSPWVTIVALVVITFLLIERVTNFSASVLDRRSDKQLLEQAELAASVLEKLPQDHRTRRELLSYISVGPVAELTERQTNRASRKRDAERRTIRQVFFVMALVLVALAYAPTLPEYYAGIADQLESSNSTVPATLVYTLNTVILLFGYFAASLVLCLFMIGVFRFGGMLVNSVTQALQAIPNAYRQRRASGNNSKA